MISTTRIEEALTRALNVRYALIGLFADSAMVGSANRIYRTAKDIFTLYALEKALYNAVSYGFDDTEIETLIYKIREYLLTLTITTSLDYFEYKYPSIVCPIIVGPYNNPGDGDGNDIEGGNTTIITNLIDPSDWYTQDLTPLITSDGITVIGPINFNIGDVNVDKDTIMLEVQGDDPEYNTNTGVDGWHMVGNMLYWHNFYDLKVGMQMKIRWRLD